MGGARQLAELTEAPFQAGADEGLLTVGIAIDRTRQEELQSQVERHVAAHAEVLENLGTAIAIFPAIPGCPSSTPHFRTCGSSTPTGWAPSRPMPICSTSCANIVDLPEVADYRAFKEEELGRFTSLLEAREDSAASARRTDAPPDRLGPSVRRIAVHL